jgi:hypothetical protein
MIHKMWEKVIPWLVSDLYTKAVSSLAVSFKHVASGTNLGLIIFLIFVLYIRVCAVFRLSVNFAYSVDLRNWQPPADNVIRMKQIGYLEGVLTNFTYNWLTN